MTEVVCSKLHLLNQISIPSPNHLVPYKHSYAFKQTAVRIRLIFHPLTICRTDCMVILVMMGEVRGRQDAGVS
jgi:hypothetical protein